MSIFFHAINRNKRSLALNLKTEQGRALFLRMVQQADVVLESFRPGVMERLGLGYVQLKELRPGIIYCAISGYGQDGPYRLRAGHDLNYAGYAGLLHYNRSPDGTPTMPATQLGDLAGGGLLAVTGILAALVGRAQTGEGRMVDVSMTEGVLALLPLAAAEYLNNGHASKPGQSSLDGGLPCYNIYETKDDKHVTLAALEQKFWHTFCTRTGHLELLPFHTPVGPVERAQAMEILRTLFKTKTRDEWVSELADIDACVGPLYSIDEALTDPHMQARDVIVSGKYTEGTNEALRALASFPRMTDAPSEQRYPAPGLGEHSNEILRQTGYSNTEIEQLRAEGIIA